jgi:hypothetical protein
MSDTLLVADGNGGVERIDGVEKLERHLNMDEMCIQYTDGSLDYYRTEDVY